jgi:hypothetical protein
MDGAPAAAGAAAPATTANVTPDSAGVPNSGAKASQDRGQYQGSSGDPAKASGDSKGDPKAAAAGKDGAAGKGLSNAQARELAAADLDAYVKMPINGKVETVTVREALKHFGLARSSYQKMQEASAIKKEAETDRELAKKNWKEWAKKQGMNPREMAEKLLAEEFEFESMSDEQRELKRHREEKAERDRIEKENQEREAKDKESKEFQKQDSEYRDKLFKVWQTSGLPASPIFGKWIAATRAAALSQGLDWTLEQCAAKVKQEYMTDTGSILEQLPIEVIHQVLPKSVIERLRDYDVKRVTDPMAPKVGTGSNPRPGSSPASGKTASSRKMLTESESREYYANLARKY